MTERRPAVGGTAAGAEGWHKGPGAGKGMMRGMDGQAMRPHSGMPYFSRPALSFVAQVRLKDGTLATFDTRQPEQAGNWPYRMLLSLIVLLVAVAAVSLHSDPGQHPPRVQPKSQARLQFHNLDLKDQQR